MHAHVEPQPPGRRRSEGEVRPDDYAIGSEVSANPRQAIRPQIVGVLEREIELHSGHLVTADDPDALPGGQLVRDHLGQGGREPHVVLPAPEVLEAEDSHDRPHSGGHARRSAVCRALRLPRAPGDRPVGQAAQDQERRPHRCHQRPPFAPRGSDAQRGREPLPAQGARDVVGGGEALGGIPTQAGQDDRFPFRMQAGRVHARRPVRLGQSFHRHGQGVVAPEGPAAGDHLVQHDAQGVDVGGGRHLPAVHLLGRHVGGRAHHLARHRDRPRRRSRRRAGEPEVGDHGSNRSVRPGWDEHDVRALEVAMDHADPVGGGEGRGDLLYDRQCLRRAHGSRPSQPVQEGLSRQQLHGQADHVALRSGGRRPGVADEVEDAADIGMRDLPRELDLAFEALGGLAPALRVRQQGLERDPHTQLEILGFVHFPHAAAGEEPHDTVAAGEQLVASEDGRSLAGRDRGGGHITRRVDSVRVVACSRGRLVGRGSHGRAPSRPSERVDYGTRIDQSPFDCWATTR